MRYHNITKDDMLNGDGLRVVLWVSGCSHCCAGCHNAVTWDAEGGLPFDEAAKQEIRDLLDKDYISGLTLSGGDPLHAANRLELREFAADIRRDYPHKTIWLYTGDTWEQICEEPLLRNIDVLVDGNFVEARKDAKLLWKGSANQRVIDVQKTLAASDVTDPILYCEDYQ
jgi:anaerobic ribonucleoside-triphosphate reductase activating protein